MTYIIFVFLLGIPIAASASQESRSMASYIFESIVYPAINGGLWLSIIALLTFRHRQYVDFRRWQLMVLLVLPLIIWVLISSIVQNIFGYYHPILGAYFFDYLAWINYLPIGWQILPTFYLPLFVLSMITSKLIAPRLYTWKKSLRMVTEIFFWCILSVIVFDAYYYLS